MPGPTPPAGWHQSLDALLARMPAAPAKQWVEAPLKYGTLLLGVYAPRGSDPQVPHEQDEVYIVMRGHGVFRCGTERRPIGVGDCLFVPARVPHRFEDFSDDLALWVVFYGPKGGEEPL